MRNRVLAAAVTAASALALTAPPAAPAERQVALTIYNNDLALVKDRRTLDFGSGRTELRFTDVAAQIDPTSVSFTTVDDPGAARILEQNFQYDLVSADRLLQKYIDAPLEVVLKDGKLHAGTLLSFDGAALVLKEGDGLVSLERGQVAEIRYGKAPGGLLTRPTLEWLLDSRGGTHPAELRYLTSGISWHAEYVGVANAANDRLELSGWVSLDNHSGVTYPDATLKLVAGDVRKVPEAPERVPRVMAAKALVASEAGAQFEEEGFFEYHLYTLQRPATVADREIKQLSLFPATSLKCRKVFTYDGSRDPKKVRVTLEAKNSKEAGLGIPLPKGKVRVYQEDASKSLQFAGEDMIDHTPKDEMLRLYVGDAFDVVGERRQVDTRRISDRANESSYEIKIRNHKAEPVTVVVVEHAWGDWTVTQKSHEFHKKDSSTFEFEVDVPANGETVVTYTVRQTW